MGYPRKTNELEGCFGRLGSEGKQFNKIGIGAGDFGRQCPSHHDIGPEDKKG
jgi:hypothetical protein